MHLLQYYCATASIYRHQTHSLKPCIYCQTTLHQPAYVHTKTPNVSSKALHLLPYNCAPASIHADTKRMALSHASTAMPLCISQHTHRHQTHDLKPCIYFNTTVQQQAYTSTAMPLCSSQLIHSHQTHGLKRMDLSNVSTAILL